MKKLLLSAAALCCFVSAQAQWTNTTDIENTNAGSVRVKSRLLLGPSGSGTGTLEWFTSSYGGGYGHKFYNLDLGNNMTQLRLAHRLGTTTWTDLMTFTSFGKVGIGTTSPAAKLDVYEPNSAGSSAGNHALISRVSTSGGAGNVVMNNHWARRSYNGSDWLSILWHDGISVDGSFLVPGSDTKTWWERNPAANTQAWGTGNATHLMINNGNLLVGKTSQVNTTYRLDVEGKTRAHEIVVNTTGADFVFADDYRLRPLKEVEQFINTNNHLPEIPSAAQMQQHGVGVGELQTKLLQKVEELTLYVIEQNKQLQALKEENAAIKKQLKSQN